MKYRIFVVQLHAGRIVRGYLNSSGELEGDAMDADIFTLEELGQGLSSLSYPQCELVEARIELVDQDFLEEHKYDASLDRNGSPVC